VGHVSLNKSFELSMLVSCFALAPMWGGIKLEWVQLVSNWCLCCRWVSVHSTMQELIIKICYNATKIRPWRYYVAGPQVTRVICRGRKYLLLHCVTNEPF
jgi:hypothetical protein